MPPTSGSIAVLLLASPPGLGRAVPGAGRQGRGRPVGLAHALLEALDGPREVAAHVRQLAGAEQQQDDQEDQDPVPGARQSHGEAPWGGAARAGQDQSLRSRPQINAASFLANLLWS